MSDTSISLHSGLPLSFFNDQEWILPCPDLTSLLASRDPTATDLVTLFTMKDELFQVCRRMSEFCSVINLAADSSQLITTQNFFKSMFSIVYPLFRMQFEPQSSDEAIRLALLALSSSVFLPWRQLGLSYHYLRSQLKACHLQIDS